MRLAEDTSSWRASGLQRRDFRHTHNGPDPELAFVDNIYDDLTQVPPVQKRKHKDTKRWCKGVVGREHAYTQVEESLGRLTLKFDLCAACGKKANHVYPALELMVQDLETL